MTLTLTYAWWWIPLAMTICTLVYGFWPTQPRTDGGSSAVGQALSAWAETFGSMLVLTAMSMATMLAWIIGLAAHAFS